MGEERENLVSESYSSDPFCSGLRSVSPRFVIQENLVHYSPQGEGMKCRPMSIMSAVLLFMVYSTSSGAEGLRNPTSPFIKDINAWVNKEIFTSNPIMPGAFIVELRKDRQGKLSYSFLGKRLDEEEYFQDYKINSFGKSINPMRYINRGQKSPDTGYSFVWFNSKRFFEHIEGHGLRPYHSDSSDPSLDEYDAQYIKMGVRKLSMQIEVTDLVSLRRKVELWAGFIRQIKAKESAPPPPNKSKELGLYDNSKVDVDFQHGSFVRVSRNLREELSGVLLLMDMLDTIDSESVYTAYCLSLGAEIPVKDYSSISSYTLRVKGTMFDRFLHSSYPNVCHELENITEFFVALRKCMKIQVLCERLVVFLEIKKTFGPRGFSQVLSPSSHNEIMTRVMVDAQHFQNTFLLESTKREALLITLNKRFPSKAIFSACYQLPENDYQGACTIQAKLEREYRQLTESMHSDFPDKCDIRYIFENFSGPLDFLTQDRVRINELMDWDRTMGSLWGSNQSLLEDHNNFVNEYPIRLLEIQNLRASNTARIPEVDKHVNEQQAQLIDRMKKLRYCKDASFLASLDTGVDKYVSRLPLMIGIQIKALSSIIKSRAISR